MDPSDKQTQKRLSKKALARRPLDEFLDDLSASSLLDSNNSKESSHRSDDKPNCPLPISEPCLITGKFSYTNEPIYWIQHGVNEAAGNDVKRVIQETRVCEGNFLFDSPENISNLDCSVHKSMETYALIAVTGTRGTLLQLHALLEKDCQRRQAYFDEYGRVPDRIIDYADPALLNPKYELVALHPEHFLPGGLPFPIFDRSTDTFKFYVSSPDQRLRETPGTLTCPPLPPFSAPARSDMRPLNPFLVIPNAEIKFRRYKRQDPPDEPLPDDVLALMDLTISLVDLIIWKPKVKEDTPKIALVQ